MPPDRPSSSILDTLQREYIVIGSRRVSSLHGWSAIALVLAGVTLGISLVANRSGEFDTSRAASTITATSCNQADVQAAIGQAVDGDTVVVPAGTCTWLTGLGISGKAITLTGSGTMPTQGAATSGGTTIVVNTSAGALIGIEESTVGNIRVQNLTITANATNAWPYYGLVVVNNRITNGKVTVLDHLTFDLTNKLDFRPTEGASAIFQAASRGVVSNSIFTGQPPPGPGYVTNRAALRCSERVDIAPVTWSTPPTYGVDDAGGVNNLYFETNRVEYYNDAIDHDSGCREVIRYNTFTNSIPKGHGNDSGFGSRHFEYYNNHFICAPGVLGSISFWIFQRGGTGVITDNIFDHIDPATCGFVPAPNSGPAVAAQIYKLTQAYIGCWPAPFGYPVTRQVGWGWNGGGTVTQDGYRQDLEPTYFWNNTNNANGSIVPTDAGVDTCGNGLHTADYFKQNRDWYLSAKPGYVKYSYPHPLAFGQTLPSSPPPPSPTPSTPVCGNGAVETGEQCDLGTTNGVCPSLCSTSCSTNVCTASTVNKFIIGDRVQTTVKLNVRANPGGGKPLGQQARGAKGTVTLGPHITNNTWYKIDYDTGVDGWSAQDYLVKI